MENSKFFVVFEPFSLNLNNGDSTVNLNKGTIVEFDGLNVDCNGTKGTASSFRTIVREGLWVRPIEADKVKEFQEKFLSKMRSVKGSVVDTKSRNVTGGKLVESSSVEDEVRVKSNKSDDLTSLVNEYEEKTCANIDPNKKFENSIDVRKKVKVDNYDDQEVAKVKVASTENKNTSGVEIDSPENKKIDVVSDEERVVKSTSYNKKVETSEPNHLEVDKDGDGVVVKKTRVPAVNKTEINEKTAKTISVEEDAVIETNYNDTNESTDVGSSTQASVVSQKTKTTTAKKSSVSKPKFINKSTDIEDHGGKVVGKVKKSANMISTTEGITSKVSVGTPKGNAGDVTFSQTGDGIEMADEAEISGSGISITDLAEMSDGVEVVSSNEDTTDSNNIDISDLLDNLS